MTVASVWTYVHDNRLPIVTFATLFITAGIKTLPIPGQPFLLYTWFYDWTHQYLNITNTRLAATKEDAVATKK